MKILVCLVLIAITAVCPPLGVLFMFATDGFMNWPL